MALLLPAEAAGRASEIRDELAALLANRVFAGRPGAAQWRFLTACIERVLAPDTPSDFDDLPPTRAAQLKFEAEDRLERFYSAKGAPVRFTFQLIHRRDLARFHPASSDDYPLLVGYTALIRDDPGQGAPPSPHALKEYLASVIAHALAAEFAAYKAVPTFEPDALSPWFDPDGSALAVVRQVATGCGGRGWVLSQPPTNPSFYRLVDVRVRDIEPGARAVATTHEFWYLRWWDLRKADWAYVYRETNRQTYILTPETTSERWRVYDNLYPPPRASAPGRRFRR